MTIPEEIEQLKLKLKQTTDEREQAEVLVELLNKHTLINSNDTQPYIEWLLQLGETLNSFKYKAWGVFHLAVLKFLKAEYDDSLALSTQALHYFELINDQQGIGRANNNIGLVYLNQGDFAKALKKFLSALKFGKAVGDKKGIAGCLCNMGKVYQYQGNYPEALKSLFSALKIGKETGNSLLVGVVYNSIGIISQFQGNYSESLEYFVSALKIKEEIGDKKSIAKSYGNIANVYCLQSNYSEALKNYNASLDIKKEIGDKNGMSSSYENIGTLFERQGDYPKALENYFRSLSYREETGNKHGIASSYNNIGGVYQKQNNYSEALKSQLAALKISEEIGSKEIIKDSFLSLTHIYKATNDLENALKYFEKYHETEKEMLGEKSIKQLNQLSFTHNLEQKEKDLEIEQLRNVELKKERDRSETLLLNILPAEVAEELKNKGSADAKLFDDVTVLFTDFKSFTKVSERLTPQQLVDELNVCFSFFDEICGKYNIEKIKTVGDAYLAVSGLPLATPNHAVDVVNAAVEIREFIKQRRAKKGEDTFDIRIGVHSGSVVAGIVGVKKFAYDIWGDTVNTAARMEQNSEAGKINISQTTFDLVKDKFNCHYRGEIEAKNKGKLKMYFVN